MVYCGKPSRGCQPCRSRKTKCDRGVPACAQCIKGSRECYGYRDEQSLIFRDETRKVVRKARRETSTRIEVPFAPRANIDRMSLTTYTPSRPIEDDAASFFFFHYVVREPAFRNGLYDFLPSLYCQGSSYVLEDIVTATGLAGLANFKRSSAIMYAARAKHSKALRAVNTSLEHLETATNDSTLMAVLLLGLFENVTCSTPSSMQTWAKHVSGALELARMRGPQQLDRDLGRRLYLHLRNQVLIDCFQRSEAVPDFILEWNADSINFGDIEQMHGAAFVEPRLFGLFTRLANLRNRVKLEGDSTETIAEAISIDNDLITWAELVPPDYAYTTAPHNYPSSPFSNQIVYKFIWSATCWNIYRTARIFTSDAIIKWHSASSQTRATQEIVSGYTQNQTRLADEICASVPYYFGANPDSSEHPVSSPKAASGFSLLWPLLTASSVHDSSGLRTDWIIKQYETIGDVLGIRLASVFANMLRKSHDLSIWDRGLLDPLENEDAYIIM